MYYLTILLLFLGFFGTPALAQEPPADEATTEEAVPADDEAVTPTDEAVAPTDEAVPEEAAEGAEEAAAPEDGVEAGEADEAAGEAAEGTDEATTVGDAADEIMDDAEAMEAALGLIDALKSKNWPLATGLILMLVVFVANKLGLKKLVGPKALPWVAMGLAVAGTVGAGLIAGLGWADAIIQGVLAGVVAIGGWELLLKNILGDKKPATEASGDAA